MKKIIAMIVAVMLILTTAALGAANVDKLGSILGGDEPITGEWSAMAHYHAATDSINEVYLDVLILGFDDDKVNVEIFNETGSVNYQETVQYHDGYLTFAPDGEFATETFVVFPMEDGMLGAYQSADGKLFAEDAPVDYYMLQPREIVDELHRDAMAELAAATEAPADEIFDIVVYLMGDHAAKMTGEEQAELAGYTAELEEALAMLFGVTVDEVNAFAADLLVGLEEMPEEDKAELDAAFEELDALIDEIPEEELIAVGQFLNDAAEALGNLTEEDVAAIEAVFNELGALIAEIPEEDLIAAGELLEDILSAIGEMTEEDIAELETMLIAMGDDIA